MEDRIKDAETERLRRIAERDAARGEVRRRLAELREAAAELIALHMAPARGEAEAGQAGQAGQAEQAERAERAEQAEQAKQAGQAEQAGQAGQTERAKQAGQAKRAEQAGQTERAEQAKQAGQAEQAENLWDMPSALAVPAPPALDAGAIAVETAPPAPPAPPPPAAEAATPVRKAVKKRKAPDFWLVYGILLSLAAIAVGCGLGYLWRKLYLYEQSTPDYLLAQYLEPAVPGALPAVLAPAARPGKYESAGEIEACIRERFAGEALRYVRSAAESAGGKEVYLFKAGDLVMAALTIEKTPDAHFGSWKETGLDIRIPTLGEIRLRIPRGAQATVNGRPPDEADRIAAELPYTELGDFPAEIAETPLQEEYLFSGLYSEPEICVKGFAGNELPLVRTEEKTETGEGLLFTAIPLAPAQDFAELEEMIWADARLYSNYTSWDAEFSALGRRMVSGTDIYGYMRTLETVWLSSNVGFAFSEEKTQEIRLYTEDCLSADIAYTYTLTGLDGVAHPSPVSLTFVYNKVNGQWLICDIILR